MFSEEISLLIVSGWKILFLAQFSGQYQAGGCHVCCSSCSRLLGSFRWAFHVALNNNLIPPRRLLKNRFFFQWPYNYYHWVLLQWYLYRESCSRLLPPHFPAISLKIEFLAIFHHFSPFVPAHGRPHDPISAFINKNVITYPHNIPPAITTPFQN